ncbi:ABC transporter C family member 3 [Galendromus occidentalis]|uniref:ABC transporter C family member 3 n=1 Tax=Galendromus occidentalis TaxID=34638 RepID=A0AAJ7SDQ7_9ACAR|nr:ABC transporter C family member 3 [Galendromus occidentalis]
MRTLLQEDLGQITREHTNELQHEYFNRYLQKEYEKMRSSPNSKSRINLWRVYIKTYWKQYLLANLLKIGGDLLALIGPISIKYIIKFIETEDLGPVDHEMRTVSDLFRNGYVLAVGVLLCTLLQSTFSNNFMHMVTMQSVYVQSALRTAIYSKTLRLRLQQDSEDADEDEVSPTTQDQDTQSYKRAQTTTSMGAIVNHMSTDCQNVMMIFTNLHYIWMLPLKIGLILYLIYGVLGISVLLSSCVLVLITPVQYLISRAMSHIQASIMSISDERMKKTRELIQGVKLLKILGWEKIFVERIQRIRSSERSLLKKDAVFVAMNSGSMVSTRRLEEFLSRPEMERITPWNTDVSKVRSLSKLDEEDEDFFDAASTSMAESFLSISNGTLEWSKGVEILRDLNLNLPSRKLTFIAGPCGAGKTTLLSAMLGELELAKGSIEWLDKNTHFVAYVPQRPWLENATVRDNIIFGQLYEVRRYRRVIEACALVTDLDTLPAGDLTEIGERGANLSGGQRQRIAIARAIYSDARLFILDDPLSALDAHVARAVFENAIQKMLVDKNKTVVMVTQKKDLLAFAHHLVILNDHTVVAKGTYDEVRADHPESLECLERGSHLEFAEKKRRDSLKPKRTKSQRKMSFTESIERNMDRAFSLTRQIPDFESSFHGSCAERCNKERRGSILSERLFLRGGILDGSTSPSRNRAHTAGTVMTTYDHEGGRLEVSLGPNENDSGELTPWRFVENEDRCEGSISSRVYTRYAKACGFFVVFLSVLFFGIMQLCKITSDFWLMRWSDINRNNGSLTPAESVEATNWYYLYVYAGMSLANVLFALVANLSAQLTTIRATKPLHDNMLERVVGCSQTFFDQNPVGRIINRFSADLNIVDRKLPISFPVLTRFILICISVALVNVIVSPVSVVFVGISFAVYWYLQQFFRASSRELQRLECITKSPIISHFSESLNGLHTIRAYGRQSDFIVRLHALLNSNNVAAIMTNSANCWLGVSLDYLGAGILFLIIVTNIVAALEGFITASSVGLTMTYTLLVPQYLNWVVKNLTSVEMYMSSVERIESYRELPAESEGRNLKAIKEIPAAPRRWPTRGLVEFENLTLQYDTSDQPVLDNVNIVIKPGEKVGICGRSGSGKSSLVLGLFQMVPLTKGQIRIDGIDLAGEDVHEVRSRLSMIPQDPILFEGSVRENLDPEGKCSDEEIWKALEKARIKDMVTEAGGLDAEISEEGSNLSTGEKQLFCLARSVLSPSQVLVLDEATSSLDVSLEDKMLEIVRDVWKEATVIAIAHRITSILDFDRVIVFKSGSISEMGDPRKLAEDPKTEFAALLRSYKSSATQQKQDISK